MDDRNENELFEMLSKNKERAHKEQRSAEAHNGVEKAEAGKENPYAFGSSFAETSEYETMDLHDIDFDDTDNTEEERTVKAAEEKTEKKYDKNDASNDEYDYENDADVIEAENQLYKHKQSRKTALQVFLGLLISAAIIFIGVSLGNKLLGIVLDYTGINTNEFEVLVDIPDDPTLNQVSDALESSGIITEPRIFKMYVEMKERQDDFVGGTFTLSSAMSYSNILDTLLASKNAVITVEVTIIEGMTAAEIGELLEENSVCRAEDFAQYYRSKLNKFDFERRINESRVKFNQMEGYLYPDKYEFYVNNELKEDPDAEIDTSEDARAAAEKIYSNFNSKISKSMYKKMNEMGFTLDELIALASMVQKEVASPEDMQNVASVFLNRLHNSESFPHLQSDATVFYVQNDIEPYYNSSDFLSSLETISNSYDTYEAVGIPAGAICSPGMDAINAVLYAPETNYFYFCANDEGKTFFASTEEEHNANLVEAGLAS